jgi:tyrosine-specific transport protein
MEAKKGTVLGATSLVAGTCIGGGMLALPVTTCMTGFFPSLFMMLIGWAFMTTTALFLAEINMWMKKDSHIISMASRFLGKPGKIVAWLLYLFIAYASLVAYTEAGGELFQGALKNIFGIEIGIKTTIVLFVLVFGSVLYLGNIILGRINTLLMFGLVLSYLFLVGLGAPHVNFENLKRCAWGQSLIAVPLLLTIFSFQGIVPSLTIYLQQDGKALRKSIFLGTTLALVIYAVWQWLVLGSVLIEGENGLGAALAAGKPATQFLRSSIHNPLVGALANFFAFFALITSFLGIALGLFDFLADGFKIKRQGWGHLNLGLMVALPVLFFTFTLEKIFLRALDMSGGIGDAILLGLMPALMLWVGRYRMGLKSEFRTPGGKPLIVAIICYSFFVFTIEILARVGVGLSF